MVAHFHYIMVGGMVAAYMGGLHYWVAQDTGRMYPSLGQASGTDHLPGFDLTFFPQYLVGYLGMPQPAISLRSSRC